MRALPVGQAGDWLALEREPAISVVAVNSLYPALTVVAFAIAIATLPLLNWIAVGAGWVDAPDERKAHQGVVPLTGGLTVIIAVVAALLVATFRWPQIVAATFPPLGSPLQPWTLAVAGLAAGLVTCFVIGFWDDRFPLRARYRLLAQISAAGLAVVAGNSLTMLGTTFSPVPIGLSLFALPVTVIALTGVANAYNMADGLDGLCGGYALVALTAFAGCALYIDADAGKTQAFRELAPVILPFVGAIAGFLIYNLRHPWRQRASSFLGDAGSMSLGFLVGWLAVRLASGYEQAAMPPVTALWIVALPLIDMFSSMIRRPLEGKPPMCADRRHLHHLLMDHGLSVRRTVWTLHALAAAAALGGIASWRLGIAPYFMFWALIAAFVAYTLYAIQHWRRRDARSRPPVSAPARAVADSRRFST